MLTNAVAVRLVSFSAILVTLALVSAAQAQAPSKAQQDAIRANCRSDFMSNCSSVTPGGREALNCLEKNKARLSSGCQGALNAISPPAPEPVKAAPAAPPPSAPPPAAPPPVAATPPSTPAAPPAAKSRPAPAPKAAAAPVRPAAPNVPAPAAPAAVAPPAAAPARKMGPLMEARLIRESCFTDFKVLCKGVQLGQGRAIRCLAGSRGALSPGCRDAMAQIGN